MAKSKFFNTNSYLALLIATVFFISPLQSKEKYILAKDITSEKIGDEGDSTTYTFQDIHDDNNRGNHREAFRKSVNVNTTNALENGELSFAQISSLLHFDEEKAIIIAKVRLKDNKDYQFIVNVGVLFAQTPGLKPESYVYGSQIMKTIIKMARPTDNYMIIYDLLGRCLFKAKKIDEAIIYANKSLDEGNRSKAPIETIEYLKGVLKNYKRSE